jgi:hypothetical protein
MSYTRGSSFQESTDPVARFGGENNLSMPSRGGFA